MSFITPDTVYAQVQKAVDHTVKHGHVSSSPNDIATGLQIANSSVLKNFVNSANVTYVHPEQMQQIRDQFQSLVGFTPNDLMASDAKTIGKKIINFNAFYIFFPMGIIILVGVWLMVFAEWFNWYIGIYVTVLLLILIYIFNVSYRIHAINAINNVQTTSNIDTFVANMSQIMHLTNSVLSQN